MSSRTWEWRDDERAELLIEEIREAQKWEDICCAENNDELWLWAGQKAGALGAIRTLFGVVKANEIERMIRESKGE